jgi:hypothetical protein
MRPTSMCGLRSANVCWEHDDTRGI